MWCHRAKYFTASSASADTFCSPFPAVAIIRLARIILAASLPGSWCSQLDDIRTEAQALSNAQIKVWPASSWGSCEFHDMVTPFGLVVSMRSVRPSVWHLFAGDPAEAAWPSA